MHAHRDMFRIEMLLVIWSGYRNYTDTIHSALLVNKRKKKKILTCTHLPTFKLPT